ncbi:TonB family protein [Sphingomonas sp.]|uniref:TonB family protein n=1 Tax=Sphingomonas sp. TaxID=28214 RepID=UPI0025E05D2A|nr:TonB family protein [Sphingomonas sp.]MBV9528414.1 TonB family protein [Sphingomonas sp.]
MTGMMRKWSQAAQALAAGSVALTSLATSAAAAPAQPVGQWTVELQGERCLAGLDFTVFGRPVKFVLEPNPTGGGGYLYVINQGHLDGYGWVYADIAIGADLAKHQVVEMMPSPESNRNIYRWPIGEEWLAKLDVAQRLWVQSEPLHADLAVTGLAQARAELRMCDSRLLAGWGFAADQQARLATFPQMDTLDIQPSDVPKDVYRHGAVGNVDGRVTVAANGKASNCRVIESSGWPTLDAKACELMVSRGIFKPAKAKDGSAMGAPYFFQFQFPS